MSAVTKDQVETALKEYIDPHTDKDLLSAKFVKDIAINGATVKVTIVLGYPAKTFRINWPQI